MALSDDQRAMLRLLAQREEGYEDIAALKGLSVEEVRAEVKAALAQLAADQEAGIEPPAPPEPPQAAEGKPKEVAPPEPAREPEVERPKTAKLAPPPAKSDPPAKPASRPARPGIPPERRRLLALAGGAVGIVAVVLIAITIFSDGSDSSPGSPQTSGSGTEAASAENGNLTQAVLEPADGSDASGRAVFGKVGKEEIVLQVAAEGLEPTEKGESYTVWLYRSPKLSLRVGSVAVGDSGDLGARFAIPAELLAYVASGAFDQIYVSRTSDAAYQREVAEAKKNKTLPRYSGETVLTGEITGPVVKK
ncbi:MAG TPA: hypothetical protein VN756_06365 [Solirubrobacterales bacterium]|nr:hypothetical protein [Solirubrobacterales bacterium]